MFIIFLIFTLIDSSALASTIYDPKTYLKLFLEADENYKQSLLEYKIQNEQAHQASDLYQTNFSLSPSTQSLWDSDLSSDKMQSTSINGGISQSLPTGTSLSFEASRFLDDPNTIKSANSYKLSLTQSLFKNSFGRAHRLNRDAANNLKQAAWISYQHQGTKSCAQAIKLYSATYAAQEAEKVYKEILTASNKMLRFSRSSYKKRMIRKIDLYSAQADHLRIQRLYIQRQREHKNAKIELVTNTNKLKSSNTFELSSLESLYRNFKSLDISIEDNLEYRALKEQSLASQKNYQATKSNNSATVDLSLYAGELHGQFNSDRSQYVDQKFIGASLNIDWAVFSKSLSSKTAEAMYNKELFESRKRDFLANFDQNKKQLQVQTQSLKEQTDYSLQQLSIYKKQNREAIRLLKSGKMEFEDYLRFRDTLLNEKISHILLRHELWMTQSQNAVLDNNQKFLCMGLNHE